MRRWMEGNWHFVFFGTIIIATISGWMIIASVVWHFVAKFW